jgi:hypothetical protein
LNPKKLGRLLIRGKTKAKKRIPQGNVEVIEQTEDDQIEHCHKGSEGIELYPVLRQVYHFWAGQ